MKWKYLLFFFIFGCKKSTEKVNPSIPFDQQKYVNVKDLGATGNGITDDTKAFNLAMDKADLLKLKVYVPNGIYKARILLSHDGLNIIGETQPTEEVNNGSVILGMIDCNSKKNISIDNIGIDTRSQLVASDEGAITSGVAIDSIALHQQFKNISIIGDGYFAYKHGILCYAGSDITIKNITVSNFYHGIAIRSSNVTVDSVYANYCGFTSVIVKSASGYNTITENVSINHVTIKGDQNNVFKRGGAVMVQSFDNVSKTKNIHIQNVSSSYGGVACILVEQLNGFISNVLIENCVSDFQGDSPDRACFDITGGDNIVLSNCNARNSNGYAYRAKSDSQNHIKVTNSFENNSARGKWIGTFTYLQLNGEEIFK